MVEIMVVVSIIGLLLVLAIPSFMNSRRNVQDRAFVNDLRVLAQSVFGQCALNNSDYPADAAPGVQPDGIADYMPKRMVWNAGPRIGGQWDWDRAPTRGGQVDGCCYACIGVVGPSRTQAQMREIDAAFDDGDLSSGNFRKTGDKYIYIVEF